MSNEYILNRETNKIELHFTKAEYKALTDEQKTLLKRSYLWSNYASAWVSRSTNNHYSAIETAKKLGFVDGGSIGERLSFAEELERKAEKAENRAERFEEYAANAQSKGKQMQSELESFRGDIAFFTQPIINGHAGSQAFARRREAIYNRYFKGFDEYRKSTYFEERAETARQTADMTKLKSKPYLHNRIEECNKRIRELQHSIITAEERNNEQWLNKLLDQMEYELDKLTFFENCMDEIGGVKYNSNNIKSGYLVKIRGSWDTVVKANSKTVEVKPSVVPYTLKYPYAEIQDVRIPEGWTEQKQQTENPFVIGDIVTGTAIGGNRIITAYQVVKTTDKTVTVQRIKVENNIPVSNEFISDKQERKTVKKDRNNTTVLNDDNWYLYKYEPIEKAI